MTSGGNSGNPISQLTDVASNVNVNLEKRLCVATVLKELELSQLEPLFVEEEV